MWPSNATSAQIYQNSRYTGRIQEDNSTLIVLNFNSLSEYTSYSIEEIRLLQYKNIQFPSKAPESFTANSVTPDRFSYTRPSESRNAWSVNSSNMITDKNTTTGHQSAGFGSTGYSNNTFTTNSGFRNDALTTGNSSLSSSNPFANTANKSSYFSSNPFGNSNQLTQNNSVSNIPNAYNLNRTENKFQTASASFNSSSNLPNNSFTNPPNPFSQPSSFNQANPFGQTNSFNQNHFNQSSSLSQLNSNFANSSNQNPFSQSNPFPQSNQNTFSQPNPFSQTNNSAPSAFNSNFSGSNFNSSPQNSNFFSANSNMPQVNSMGNNNFFMSSTQSRPFTASNSFYSQPGLVNNQNNPFSNQFSLNPMYSSDTNPYMPSPANTFTNDFYGNSYAKTNSTILLNPYIDPFGLSWIFPDKDPQKLISEFKGPEVSSSFIQIFPKKNKFESIPKSTEQENFSIFDKPKTLANLYKKTDQFMFQKREKHKEIKYRRDINPGAFDFKQKELKSSEDDLITFKVVTNEKHKQSLSLKAYPESNISEIKEKISATLNNSKQFNLFLSNRLIPGYETMQGSGINKESVLILEFIDDNFISFDVIPKSSKLEVKPSIEEMYKMDLEELKEIEGLTLMNEFGMIVFEGKTDVTGVDFDKIVEFRKNEFIGFPDGVLGDCKLNKPGIVTLFGMRCGKNSGKYEVGLRISCQQNGTEFVKYDKERGEFTFKINHL